MHHAFYRIDCDLEAGMKALFRESGLQNGTHKETSREVSRRPCAGFQKLMRWQIAQYHSAVEEYKRTLSKSKHAGVSWSEAEEAFCEQQCPTQSQEWRSEYCGNICEHRETCPLAELFHNAA